MEKQQIADQLAAKARELAAGGHLYDDNVAAINALADSLYRRYPGAVAQPSSGRQLGDRGLGLIKGFEGYEATTYPDPGPTGLPVTGGYGSTLDENGHPFKLGVTHDQAYWDALLRRDVAKTVADVNKLLGNAPTTQNQFDALVSFAYNVGTDMDGDGVAEGLGDSTLLRKHRAGDYMGAKAQFALWNKAKGVVLAGLTRRRAAEAELYGLA